MECIRQKYQEREHTPYWMPLFLCSPYFSLCFIIPELLPLVMLPSGILNLAFWKITLDWRRAFRSFIVAQREDFNHETQSLETCKFCVLTHLWWRCSPPGLIPHRAIYKSPVISFKEKAHTMIRTAQAKQYLRRTLYMIIILYRMHESE